MKILFIQKRGYTGRDGVEHPCGTIAEFDDHLALKLVDNRIAVPAPAAPKVEIVAKAAPTRTTARRVGKAKPRKAVK